jgi:hypothetical protein
VVSDEKKRAGQLQKKNKAGVGLVSYEMKTGLVSSKKKVSGWLTRSKGKGEEGGAEQFIQVESRTCVAPTKQTLNVM